jgi:hypothetical protein
MQPFNLKGHINASHRGSALIAPPLPRFGGLGAAQMTITHLSPHPPDGALISATLVTIQI